MSERGYLFFIHHAADEIAIIILMISGPIKGRYLSRYLPFILFVVGASTFLADAWIRNERCMTVGLMMIAISLVIYPWREHKMKKAKLLRSTAVYGMIFWMTMFIAVSILIAFRLYDSILSKIAILTLAGLLGYLFSKKTKPQKMMMAVFMGAGFVAIGLILDGLVTYRFDPTIFSQPYLWAGYIFVLIGAIAGGCICSRSKK